MASLLEEHPRQRLLKKGADALSDSELVAVLLGSGCPGATALDLARELLENHGGLAGILYTTNSGGTLRCRGVGNTRHSTLVAAVELARRMARAEMPHRQLLNRPESVADYLSMRYSSRDQEILGALYLDGQNRLIIEREIFRGCLQRTAVEPRSIMKYALTHSAPSLILFHNHTSGHMMPSAEDLAFTHRIYAAGEILGIKIADHIILGAPGRWLSLSRLGVLKPTENRLGLLGGPNET